MNAFFSLLEQLVALVPPSIVVLNNLLGVTLVSVEEGQYWHYYKARSDTGLVASVDYRVPRPGAPKTAPFLVVGLRESEVGIRDLEQRYGEFEMTDLSADHPWFIGYTFYVHGRPVSVGADSETGLVIYIAIDYSEDTRPANN